MVKRLWVTNGCWAGTNYGANKSVHEVIFSNYKAGNKISDKQRDLKSDGSCQAQTSQQRCADKDNCHAPSSLPLQKGLTPHRTF